MRYLVFILSLIFFSCSEPAAKKKEPIPNDIMAPDLLSKVLADIYLIDAAVSIKRLSLNPQPINVPKFYENVYWKHGVTKEKFTKSLKYYSAHPTELDEIYTDAINLLSELQANEASKK